MFFTSNSAVDPVPIQPNAVEGRGGGDLLRALLETRRRGSVDDASASLVGGILVLSEPTRLTL
jgi:hypothetical protein